VGSIEFISSQALTKKWERVPPFQDGCNPDGACADTVLTVRGERAFNGP
jgi:hypothetical protein